MIGVSGVRGVVGTALTLEVARDFGCAFAALVGAGKKVIVARDTRVSGPEIRSAVTDGLRASGVSVINLGVVTTPSAALMTRQLHADGAVVITASHNPAEYNGLKFLQPSGCGLTVKDAQRLTEIYRERRFSLVDSEHQGTAQRNDFTHDEHISAVLRISDADIIASKRFKVVLDSINGGGCFVSPMLFEKLGVELVHVNGEPTGLFAHAPEPIAENLTDLCDAVRQHDADVGFAQDPDADRLAIVDETGKFIGEEYTLALGTAFVLRHRKGKLATNLATSRMIDDIAAAAGVEVVRAPIGEANVVEAMEREGCIFGGEGNGGVIDPRVVPVRDSLVAMAMVLQFMAETGKKVSELAAEIPSYVFIKRKMPCPPGAADKAIERTREVFADRDGAKFNDADGLRIDLPEGWVSVRASNTEPILRVMAEAPDAATAEALADEVEKIARQTVGGGK
jgi:phosphomannomutase